MATALPLRYRSLLHNRAGRPGPVELAGFHLMQVLAACGSAGLEARRGIRRKPSFAAGSRSPVGSAHCRIDVARTTDGEEPCPVRPRGAGDLREGHRLLCVPVGGDGVQITRNAAFRRVPTRSGRLRIFGERDSMIETALSLGGWGHARDDLDFDERVGVGQ